MEIKPIRSEADYQAALKEIEKLIESQPGTPEGDRMEVLVTLVEALKPGIFLFQSQMIRYRCWNITWKAAG